LNREYLGSVKGDVRLELTQSYPELFLEEKYFSIPSRESYEVKVKFTSSESGIFRGKIQVITNVYKEENNFIEVAATSVEYAIYLIDQNGNRTSSFRMPSLINRFDRFQQTVHRGAEDAAVLSDQQHA